MGGSSYDRDVYSSSSSSSGGWGTSTVSTAKLKQYTMDPAMNPKGKVIRSTSKNPIIVMLDVTGSNINFARLVYDKLPMFYGQIEQKGYLDDFDISICAVGDAYTDKYPLQVSDFARGLELDSWMEKLVLEGNGGGQCKESYELAAYYLLKMAEFDSDATPVVFFIGDESPYPRVDIDQAKSFDIPIKKSIDPFSDLRKKFNDNVYMLLNKYGGGFRDHITKSWTRRLAPEHVIMINEEKAIIDLMLGILAIMSRKSLKTYALDMKDRGQTDLRIEGVTQSLQGLSTALVPMEHFKTSLPTSQAGNTGKDGKKGKRL